VTDQMTRQTEPRRAAIVDLGSEASSLFDAPASGPRDRSSRTVISSDRMRITLTSLDAGAEMGSEGNDDTLAVQLLRGAARLDVAGGSDDLRPGQLAALADPGEWRLVASEDSLLLITVALGSRPETGR
jgi:quercetin dioxygenase-like cupin family protein